MNIATLGYIAELILAIGLVTGVYLQVLDDRRQDELQKRLQIRAMEQFHEDQKKC